MADSHIFTALNVPTPAPQPSIVCAQWSGDGQLILCTKSSIYILTPDLGINFDNLSLLKTDRRNFQDSSNTNGSKDSGMDLGWHRNLIEIDKTIAHQWPMDTQEWGALSLGSLDVSWRAVTVSPSNLNSLTTGSGCLLVVMSTNSELTLWYATKNHLKEAWSKVQDITSTLKEFPLPQCKEGMPQDRIAYLKTMQAQVNSMSWSQQADFGLHPDSLVDGSMLALGNRAGSIILMRYDGKQAVRVDHVVRIADEWVTHLAWGSWRAVQPFHSEVYLACGIADGSIVIVRIRQKLELVTPVTPFSPEFSIRTDADVLDTHASSADGKGITALSWVDRAEIPHEKPTLFHAKPGLFRFFQLQPPERVLAIETDMEMLPPQQHRGDELATLRVQAQKTSVGSSSLSPVAGLSRIADPERDMLLVTLFDGSFHVVRDVCTAPTIVDATSAKGDDAMDVETSEEGSSTISSASVSRTARATFVKTEGGALQPTDVGRISGVISFDGAATFTWLHERCRPTDFSYKHDAKHNSMFVVARLWNDHRDIERLFGRIQETIEHPRPVLGHAPAYKLRPILLHLCQRKIFDAIWPRVLEFLPAPLQEGESASIIEPWEGQVDDGVRRAFRRSLSVDLYGSDSFHSRRLRLAVADYCWKMSSSDEVREKFGNVAQALLNGISHRFMKVVVKHLTAVLGSLNEQDLPFLMRVIVQSLLDGSPPDLAAQAHELNEAAKVKFHTVAPDAFGLTEPCPACGAAIALENLLNAVCPMGHVWARCSITSFVLSTPMVRTCVGCTRKAFLAPSSRSPGPTAFAAATTTSAADTPVGDAAGSSSTLEGGSVPPPPAQDVVWIPEAGCSWIVDELLEAARCCLYCGNRFVRIL